MESVPTAPPTQVLEGKYRLLRRLADAGNFEQYLGCTVTSPIRAVVVKRVPARLAKNKPTVAAFLEEARTTAHLQHASIARVLDVGEDGGTYVAVFEHLFGLDLDAVLEAERQRRGEVPVAAAVEVVCAVLEALEYAHQAPGEDGAPLQLIHRDVSAKNVLAGYDGAVQLAGFGLAKHQERQSENTSFGVVRGQLAYLSPEQLRGQELDARSDLWATAVLLYQLLTGVLPFERQGEFHQLKAIREEPHRPPGALRASLPPALDALFDRALAKDREARFASAGALREALVAAAGAGSRGAVADHLAELFAHQLGPHLADAVAGKAGIGAVLAVVGGEVIGEPPVVPSTESAPVPFEDVVVHPTEPREALPRSRAAEPSEPTLDTEPPRREAPRPRVATREPEPRPEPVAPMPPPKPRIATREPEPRPEPVAPMPPPRQRAPPSRPERARSKNVAAPARPRPARQKARFRLVSERGLNPLCYPAAIALGALLALGLTGARAGPIQAVPLRAGAPWAALDGAAKPAAEEVAQQVRPASPPDAAPPADPGLAPSVAAAGTADNEIQLAKQVAPETDGTLHVEGPRGTRIYLDRKPRGLVPATFTLPAGTHALRLVPPRGAAREESVRIEPGAVVRRSARSGKYVPPQPKVNAWP